MALSAGDKASCSVMTRVPSLKTTVTDLGTWLPVRRCSKAIAARAICWAKVELDLLISVILGGRDSFAPPQAKKKPTWSDTPKVSDHVGLLVNEPPGTAGLPFN